MTKHPSLNAKFIGPEPIQAVAQMPPYDPCWCGSSKKYKFCHFRREQQEPINIFQVEQEMLQKYKEGYCSYPKQDENKCSPKISKAHTIQRRGGLAAISEKDHVLSVKPTMQGIIEHKGKPPPKRISAKKASVFPGFCNKHDTAIFKPIEGTQVDLNKSSALLFAYRAIAYERYAKEVQLEIFQIQRKMDCGHPLERQEVIQQRINGLEWGAKIGMRDVNNWKHEYDSKILSGNLGQFHFHAVRFNRLLPIVGCGAFHPEYDLQGNMLQQLARPNFEFEHLTFNITAFEDQTVAFFGWTGKSDGPASIFVKSFEDLPQDRKADAVVRIAFEQMDNIFLQPSWWNGLSKEDQSGLVLRTRSGSTDAPRTSECLIDNGTTYATGNIVEFASG